MILLVASDIKACGVPKEGAGCTSQYYIAVCEWHLLVAIHLHLDQAQVYSNPITLYYSLTLCYSITFLQFYRAIP